MASVAPNTPLQVLTVFQESCFGDEVMNGRDCRIATPACRVGDLCFVAACSAPSASGWITASAVMAINSTSSSPSLNQGPPVTSSFGLSFLLSRVFMALVTVVWWMFVRCLIVFVQVPVTILIPVSF
ncbi:hypothetical protein KCU62_g425, partial [Aureobasidium sp. EXF-3399]